MILDILLIIAFWNIYNLVDGFPIALTILITIFGSLHCVFKLIRGISAANKKYKERIN